jgi:hypothetical protein
MNTITEKEASTEFHIDAPSTIKALKVYITVEEIV